MNNCPVCDREPGEHYKDPTKCEMWHTLRGRRCTPNYSDFQDCYAHARPLRELTSALGVELAELRAKLRAAQAALGRHHDAQHRAVEPFRDGARIE